MKLAMAFSTKDRVELTEETWARLREAKGSTEYDVFWLDGSKTDEGKGVFDSYAYQAKIRHRGVIGGADAAIVFGLTEMLSYPEYTHVGLVENDVLLPLDWFESCMRLFDTGTRDGLVVGAVSARTYADRILIQRSDYALLHNAGAGHVVFTREAAKLVLEFYRTGWWPDNRAVFSKLSGLDIGEWGAFRTVDAPITADWHFDTILAAHGLATLGLTPSHVDMIGQNPSLEEQGLVIAREPIEDVGSSTAFERFALRSREVRAGRKTMALKPWMVQRSEGGQQCCTYFPHQFEYLNAVFAGWTMQWSQGYGPFSYVANRDAICTVPVYGAACFVMSGGKKGAKVRVVDTRSGFEAAPQLPPETDEMRVITIQIPGGAHYRYIHIEAGEGARLFSMQTNDEQPWHTRTPFDYSSLPKVYE